MKSPCTNDIIVDAYTKWNKKCVHYTRRSLECVTLFFTMNYFMMGTAPQSTTYYKI